MPALRSREVAITASAFALITALSIAGAILSPPADDGMPPGSSYSHAAAGAAAAYRTLERLGYPIRRSFEPISALAIDPASTVLILADPAEFPSNADRRALQSLVTGGATVLATGCGGLLFLGTDSGGGGGSFGEMPIPARFPSPLSEGAPQIKMRGECTAVSALESYTVLYGDDFLPSVKFRRSGSGLAVWWAGSMPLTNGSIAEPGHLELLLNLAGDGGRTIVWDEFYHGQRRSLYSYARSTPLPWAAAQIGLVTLVAAAMYARRRAPILERVAEPRTSPLEFVDTMAGLYGRAGTAGDAVATARARLRRLLSAATGLAPDAADDRLAAAAAARRGLDAAEVRAVLAASAGLSNEDVTPHEALAQVQRLQACAAALERAGG